MDKTKMMEDNIGLIYKYYHIHNVNDEDRQQEIAYAYCKAVKKYKPDNKHSFSTYIFTVIDNHLKKQYYLSSMQKRTFVEGTEYFSLDQRVKGGEQDIDVSFYEDIIGFADYDYETAEIKLDLEKVLSTFTAKQVKVITLILEGKTKNEVATIMGNTNQAVSEMLRRCKDEFKRKMGCY